MKTIVWKIHLKSPKYRVFKFLSTGEGRAKFWAESANESKQFIIFKFINGIEYKSKIISSIPNSEYIIEYFNTTVKFSLSDDGSEGTDLVLTNTNVPDEEYLDMYAGWLSVLFALKGACDYDIDLRNHDTKRTWDQGFADN